MDSYKIGENIKSLRLKYDKTQTEVSKILGITFQAYSNYELGKRTPTPDVLYKLANIYNVSVDSIITGIEEKPKSIKVPVLGVIPAGIPIEMIEDVLDYEELSGKFITSDKQYFALKVQGNSMNPKYLTGDNVIVLKTDDCESGQDCVVAVNGSVATLKRVVKNNTGIVLQPLNPDYEMKYYSNEDVEKLPVKILGVVVEIRRKV